MTPRQLIYMISKRSFYRKVPLDIFRSDTWSCCCTFLFKQAREGVIDAVCNAVLEALGAHLTVMVILPGPDLPSALLGLGLQKLQIPMGGDERPGHLLLPS